MDYIHDEWCDMDNEGMCDCYVSLLVARDVHIAQLEADLEERTKQYHLAHAKILSREAIIEQLSETQLAKDVAQLEKKIERMRERLVEAYTPSPKIIQLEEKNRQLEAELHELARMHSKEYGNLKIANANARVARMRHENAQLEAENEILRQILIEEGYTEEQILCNLKAGGDCTC